MNQVYEKLMTCVASIREKIDFKPEIALILGSGLGDYADEIQIEQTISYTEIEGFPTSTVAGQMCIRDRYYDSSFNLVIKKRERDK